MNKASHAIEVERLEKGYKGTPVLEGISFTVGRGSVFALLGPNGSGKTTTINILTTLIRADSGTAKVGGFDVATHPAKVREQITLTGRLEYQCCLSGGECVAPERVELLPEPSGMAAVVVALVLLARWKRRA